MTKTQKIRNDYFPHDAQMPFHNDRYKAKFRGLIAGTGSGKTLAGGKEALDWTVENPGSAGLVAAPAFRKFREVIIPTFENLLNAKIDSTPFFTRYNRAEMSLEVFNGSKIWMIGLDKAEAAEGMNIDWAWVDEARLIPKFGDAWNSILRRLRGSGLSHPLDDKVPTKAVGAWVTTTPDHPGSSLHAFFEGRNRDPDSKVYRMSIDDNLANLGEAYVEGMKRTHSGGFYDRFILGRFAAIAVGAFELDYVVHVQGFETLFLKENMKRIAYGVDFGWTSPSAVVAVGLDGDERAYVADEIYRSRLSEDDLIAECELLKTEWGDGTFWCDASEPRTITALRRAGINARANKTKRDDGIRELGGRFKDAGDDRRRLYISPSCVNLIEELQLYDADKKEHDHAVDALRYAVMGAKGTGGRIEGHSVYRKREITR